MATRRARVLRGPIEVSYSVWAPAPRWHIDPECQGLERTPPEARGTRIFTDAFALGGSEEGRPCRMCALESVLRTTLRPWRLPRNDLRLVTFTSQPLPNALTDSPLVTPSGERRVRRLARALRLGTTSLPGVGVIAYGNVNRHAAPVLAANLRTHTLGRAVSRVPAETVECFWMLAGESPDADLASVTGRYELWRTARLLTR